MWTNVPRAGYTVLRLGKTKRDSASFAFGHIYRQVMRESHAQRADLPKHVFPTEPADGWVDRQASRPGQRVAVFASGGMSHFVIDEEFDGKFVAALAAGDADYLTSIPLKDLQSGTSELKSWISLAGVLEKDKAEMTTIDYVPCYRSAAGTGTANGFYWWNLSM